MLSRFAAERDQSQETEISSSELAEADRKFEALDKVDDDDVSFTYIGSPDDDSILKSHGGQIESSEQV